MLKSDKRGISVIIGYILLIGIAIGLSVMVYNWLVFFLPGEEIECPDTINLDLRDVSCNAGLRELNFSVRNNGLFSFDGFVVKVNHREDARIGVYNIGGDNGVFNEKISPGDEPFKVEIDYNAVDYPGINARLTLLDVLPFLVNDEGNEVYCHPSTWVELNC